MQRIPAAVSASIWWRQRYDESGNPCRSSTGRPSASSRTASSTPSPCIGGKYCAIVEAMTTLDPFGDAFLADPYPGHETLRELGPAVWLERYGVYGMARFEHVDAALRDPETYCSRRGVGLSDFAREKPWRPPSLLL